MHETNALRFHAERTGDIIELPNIAKYEEAIPAARQLSNIPEDWTVSVIENKTTEIVVACASPAYGLITPEKYEELRKQTASGLSAILKPAANPRPVIVVVTYAHINNRRKTDRHTQELRVENDQSRQDILGLWVTKVRNGMYAQGCANIEDSRIRGRSGRAGGIDIGSGVESKSSALAMSTQRQCLPT
jgi:hypothetical protein